MSESADLVFYVGGVGRSVSVCVCVFGGGRGEECVIIYMCERVVLMYPQARFVRVCKWGVDGVN